MTTGCSFALGGTTAALLTGAALAAPLPQEIAFHAPVRLKAGGEVVRTEAPGFAAPCWHDVDGDGRKDLVVGQFHDGKIKVHRNLGDDGLAVGTWLEADGDVAQVPGVW